LTGSATSRRPVCAPTAAVFNRPQTEGGVPCIACLRVGSVPGFPGGARRRCTHPSRPWVSASCRLTCGCPWHRRAPADPQGFRSPQLLTPTSEDSFRSAWKTPRQLGRPPEALAPGRSSSTSSNPHAGNSPLRRRCLMSVRRTVWQCRPHLEPVEDRLVPSVSGHGGDSNVVQGVLAVAPPAAQVSPQTVNVNQQVSQITLPSGDVLPGHGLKTADVHTP